MKKGGGERGELMKEISKHTERAFNSSADFNANDHSNSNPSQMRRSGGTTSLSPCAVLPTSASLQHLTRRTPQSSRIRNRRL